MRKPGSISPKPRCRSSIPPPSHAISSHRTIGPPSALFMHPTLDTREETHMPRCHTTPHSPLKPISCDVMLGSRLRCACFRLACLACPAPHPPCFAPCRSHALGLVSLQSVHIWPIDLHGSATDRRLFTSIAAVDLLYWFLRVSIRCVTGGR